MFLFVATPDMSVRSSYTSLYYLKMDQNHKIEVTLLSLMRFSCPALVWPEYTDITWCQCQGDIFLSYIALSNLVIVPLPVSNVRFSLDSSPPTLYWVNPENLSYHSRILVSYGSASLCLDSNSTEVELDDLESGKTYFFVVTVVSDNICSVPVNLTATSSECCWLCWQPPPTSLLPMAGNQTNDQSLPMISIPFYRIWVLQLILFWAVWLDTRLDIAAALESKFTRTGNFCNSP